MNGTGDGRLEAGAESLQRLTRDGFVRLTTSIDPAALDAALRALEDDPGPSAGDRRLLTKTWCSDLATAVIRDPALSCLIPECAVAVQATLFDKNEERNWLVGLHQDLSVPVAERADVEGFTGWSLKDGIWFVQPPIGVLERLVALRLHLDDCLHEDGALRVVPGSHLGGRLDPVDARAIRDREGDVVCEAGAGDVLALKPLLLHASSKSRSGRPRRVLHFLFGPERLPRPLAWHRYA